MKQIFKLKPKAGKILSAGFILLFLLTGCFNNLFDQNNIDGNVTITIGLGERTLRPGNINESAFERFEITFTNKDNGSVMILNITKPAVSGSINLEPGTWDVNAFGFMNIDGREYEAARGYTSITVGSGSINVPITLQTGIFEGAPGVFKYNIDYPANVNEAVLSINPLPGLHGYGSSNAGETKDLTQGKSGSFELLPGYYLLSLSAKTNDNMMSFWNELVHIYSGRETTASHTFITGDFSGSITLSGTVNGGELNGEHITAAVVTAYADSNHLNRIASVDVTSFIKQTVSPFEYTGAWSINVPSALTGKDIYFVVEETLSGPNGTRNYSRSYSSEVSDTPAENTNIILKTSYTWVEWSNKYYNNYEIKADFLTDQNGVINVKLDETNTTGDYLEVIQILYPAEIDIRYVIEFEAWTENGEHDLAVIYATRTPNSGSEPLMFKQFIIDETPKSFVLVSDTRISYDWDSGIAFFINDGNPISYNGIGSYFIKIKSITDSRFYVPPNYDDQPRLTATPHPLGIHLKADLRGLPDGCQQLQFYNETTGASYEIYGYSNIFGDNNENDFYEFIYPYVQAGKEYTFSLQFEGISLRSYYQTVTATAGRGDFYTTNGSELAIIIDNNTARLNKEPVLPVFDKTGADIYYRFAVVSGTSWFDPAAIWRYPVEFHADTSGNINLTDIDLTNINDNIPFWVGNYSEFFGKTCFMTFQVFLSIDESELFPTGSFPGEFTAGSISSTPFTHPNVIPGLLTAEQHPEGIKLTIDVSRIPRGTEQIGIYLPDRSSMECYINSYNWKSSWSDYIELIYPFVQAGQTYSFEADFNGSGIKAISTPVTANAGLGKLNITNMSNLGLFYNSSTQTASLSSAPVLSSFNNTHPKIDGLYWEWQFYEGINWNNSRWVGILESEDMLTSIVIDTTFNPGIISDLSNKMAFINLNYVVGYDEIRFSTSGISSPSFRFPHFDPSVQIIITTPFDVNNNIKLHTYSMINQGDDLYIYIQIDSFSGSASYEWYIEGVKQEGYTNQQEDLPTSGLEPGIYYGLAVVYIDGVPFAQEFSFRVNE